MGNTVYADGMGFFHQGSNGKGIAPGDVCLSPPPPPAGPVPVPYVNMLSASDLTKGSKSVKIEGNPTALESSSEIATSTGNEPATQGLGAGVITHKIKGKGAFKLWSFTVKVEGKGVDRHGDPMGQNEMSDPPNCIDSSALVNFFKSLPKGDRFRKCARKYNGRKHRPSRKSKQAKKVNGKACWECQRDLANMRKRLKNGAKLQTRIDKLEARINRQKTKGHYMIHDHQPPLVVAWRMGGCHMGAAEFKKHFSKPQTVKPHCTSHQRSQGSKARAYSKRMNASHFT
ncbi:DUF4150 domain-containing protein [Mesorhizobium temperatum]|uniref:Uncharacterized protein n=1 Tax=Mesorhizobium temperatum TaxID=241416 RepID=A0A271LT71_9HYPH|nr:DUF4150 domain-containing protein [Mesorhizobium temperatum]PAQ10967.1 hypothetical protein CIT26_06625 [Mesorhizobium temperatum]